MESLSIPNTPEEHIYACVYTALDRVRSENPDTDAPLEREIYGAEFRAALNILGKYEYPLPNKITYSWLSEPAHDTALGTLGGVEVAFIHFSYTDTTTLYSFTRNMSGDTFCDKEIMDERHAASIEEVILRQLLEVAEPEAEITNTEIAILSEMIGASLSASKPV